MTALFSGATSYAFATASSYVFRADASTSTPTPPSPVAQSIQPRRTHRKTASSLPAGLGSSGKDKEKSDGERMVDSINREEDLYKILGVSKKVKVDEIRRAFLGRSKICHPDKLPHYPPATPAFQRLSYAYETLSKPGSRRLYDVGGGRGYDPRAAREATAAGMGDETLHGVLRGVFAEFMSGDFETIRVFVNSLNEGNPGLNLGDETVDNLEAAFRRVRDVLLSGQKYLGIIRFELIRLYEIQHSLRSLRYLDLVGRLRLTLALTRVTLEIPLVLDKAMRDETVARGPRSQGAWTEGEEEARDSVQGGRVAEEEPEVDEQSAPTGTMPAGELQRRGLLGPRVKGMLVITCKVIEKVERLGM